MQPKTNLTWKPWTLSSLIPYSVIFGEHMCNRWPKYRTKCGRIICKKPLTGPKAHWIKGAMFVQLIISMLTQSLKIGTVLSTALLNQPFYKLEMSRIYRRDQLPTAGQLLKISNSKHILCFSWRHYQKIYWRGETYLATFVTIKATNALDAKHYRCRPSYMWSLTIFSNYSSHSVLAITIYLFAQNPFPS